VKGPMVMREHLIAALPLTRSGKIDHSALRISLPPT
jgi:hypothetical protein